MRRHLSTALSLVLFLIAWGVAACISAPGPRDDAGQPLAARPLPAGVNALEASLSLELAEMEGEEHPSLHNLFTLSPNIISGGEPATSAALEALALRGVKTIVSVDGKVPDSATAAQLGMRYVHIPIQYKGITEDELLALAKTFRELEAPFFVHCFH
ncbi:MAG: hypothetical protein QF615_06460, partial [Planctomycetota bacterium]|nr:hypothetical protein [Planctomycetota bacterium]